MARISVYDALTWIVFGDDGPQYKSKRRRNRDGSLRIQWIGDIDRDSKHWDEALKGLIKHLHDSKLVARGRRNGIGEPQGIPEDFWHGRNLVVLEAVGRAFYEYDYSRDTWYEITVEFADIKRLWPRKGVLSDLGGDGQKEPAEDGQKEPVASDRRQVSRSFSEATLKKWYRETWIKRNQEKGHIPTRDDDWAAAKNEVSPYVPREAVRRSRREFAPESWVARGRRHKKIGDN